MAEVWESGLHKHVGARSYEYREFLSRSGGLGYRIGPPNMASVFNHPRAWRTGSAKCKASGLQATSFVKMNGLLAPTRNFLIF